MKWLPVCGSNLSFHCKKMFYTEHKEVDWRYSLRGKCERSAVSLDGGCVCEDVSFLIMEKPVEVALEECAVFSNQMPFHCRFSLLWYIKNQEKMSGRSSCNK